MSTPPQEPAGDRTPEGPGEEEREGLSRVGFVSEEGETEGGTTPRKDFFSAVAIAALALGATWLGLVMENPGRSFFTSPGLLPVLVGLSLFAMAVGQGVGALRRGGGRALFEGLGDSARDYFAEAENRSALFLMGLVFAYVVLIDVLSFDPRIPLGFGGAEIRFSSYEAVTIVILTYILRIFWKKPLLQCLLVSFLTSTALSLAFRHGFQLIMPGVS